MKIAAQKRQEKEKNNRYSYLFYEPSKRLWNFVYLSSRSDKLKVRLAYFLIKSSRRIRSTLCKHYCPMTGSGHSMYGFFHYNRNAIKFQFHRGMLYGLKKAS